MLDARGIAHVDSDRRMSVPELVRAEFGARGATVTTAENFTSWWVPYDHDNGLTVKATEHWFAGAAAVRIA